MVENRTRRCRATRAARAQAVARKPRASHADAAGRRLQRRRWPVTRMFTIEEFGRKLRAREVSAAEMTDECLRRIADGNARINAFIHVMTDEARRQAHEADRELASGRDRGALHGVPVSIKDIFDIRGTATTAASR